MYGNMTPKLYKVILLILLLIFSVAVTLNFFTISNGEGVNKIDSVSSRKNKPSVEMHEHDSGSNGCETPVSASSSASSPSSGDGGGPKKSLSGTEIGNVVNKVLKSDEDLNILVTEGMVTEFDKYFNVSKLKPYNLSPEMEEAVAAQLRKLCVGMKTADDKCKADARKQYKKTVGELKKKFHEEYGKEPEKKKKNPKKKSVRIDESVNETKRFKRNSPPNKLN